jgi:hypothetical protein
MTYGGAPFGGSPYAGGSLVVILPPVPLTPPIMRRLGPPAARPTLEVAFINNPYDDAPTYVDLSQYLRDDQEITFNRGKQNELAEFDAGDFSCILDPALVGDNRRALEPEYAGGLYYPNVRPDKRCRYQLEFPWLPGLLDDPLFNAVGNWEGGGNTTLSLDAGRSFLKSGSGGPLGNSLQLTAIAGGDISARSPWIPLAGDEWIAGSTRFLYISGGAGRTVNLQIEFYDLTGTVLLGTSDQFWSDSAVSWSRVSQALQAPPGTTWVRFKPTILGCNAGEKHDICMPAYEYAKLAGVFPQITTFADNWNPVWPGGMDAWMALSGHDGFKLLGGKNITNLGFAEKMISLNPFAYYRLGDPLNSRLAKNEMDSTAPGQVNDADPSSGLTWVFGVEGAMITDTNTAADCEGGWVDCGTAAAIVGNTDFSITFLCIYSDLDTISNSIIVQAQAADSPTSGWLIVPSNGVIPTPYSVFGIQGPGPQVSEFSFPLVGDQRWHLVTITREADGKTYHGYMDGAEVTLGHPVGGTIVGQHFVSTWALNLAAERVLLAGRDDYIAPFQGNLDEVAFSNTAMSLADHQELWSLVNTSLGSQLAGYRIGSILDAIGWPASDRSLDPGTTTMPPITTSLAKTNTKDYLQQVEQADGGQLLMGTDNEVTFLSRDTLLKAPYTRVQAVFGDRPGTIDPATGLPELPYGPTTPTYGDSTVYGEVTVTRQLPDGSDGPAQVVSDPSAPDNAQRTLQRDKVILPDDETAWEYANWLYTFYKNPVIRFDKVELNPIADVDMMEQALTRKILDRVAIVRRPPGWQPGDDVMRVECVITGISGSDGRNKFNRTYQLGQVASTPYIILDDPVYGILDAGNYLGY